MNYRSKIAAFVLVFAARAIAQEVKPEASSTPGASDDSVITLTPFQVSTDKDRGYQATNSLAGGRTNTALKLTPSSISAMTPEFMDDFGIKSMTQAFHYTLSVHQGTLNQNGSIFGNFQYDFRGSGGSGNYPSRNYFIYYGISDSYNTERFEFARGPNAILFGDGQIGGLATTFTKVPKLDRKIDEIELIADSEGGTRATFDVNQPLGEHAAIRVNGLISNKMGTDIQAWRDDAYDLNRSIDVALLFKLTPTTTFRVESEYGGYKAREMATNYTDQLGYYAPKSYIYNGTNALPTQAANPNGPNQTSVGVTPVGNAATAYYVWAPAIANTLQNWGNNTQFRSAGTGFAIEPDTRNDLPGIQNNVKLPSREFFLGPNDTWAHDKFRAHTFFLDHRFGEEVNAQLSFYDYINDRQIRENAQPTAESIDVNQFLPNGQPNPKVGVPYSDVTPSRQRQYNYVYEWRASVTWKHAFQFARSNETLSLIAGDRQERFEAKSETPFRVDGPDPIYTNTNGNNLLHARLYWDQPNAYALSTLPPPTPGNTYAWEPTGFSTVELKQIQYIQAVSATTLFDERISLLLGTRNDDLGDDQYGNLSLTDAHGLQIGGGFVPQLNQNVRGVHNIVKAGSLTSNAGIVAYVDKTKIFGVTFNYSENFSPPTSGTGKIIGWNTAGEVSAVGFGPARGRTKDWGVRVNLLDGELYFTATRYTSTQSGAIDQNAPTATIQDAWLQTGSTNTNLTQIGFRDVDAKQLTGYEFEITANPTKNIRLIANYALPDGKNIAVRPTTNGYINAFVPVWQGYVNDTNNPLTAAQRTTLQNDILTLQNNIAGTVAGTRLNAIYKWQGSVAVTYEFDKKPLKGLSVGVGSYFTGPEKVGTVDARILYGVTTATPEQNTASGFAYLYAPSYAIEDGHVTWVHKFGKQTYRFQFNVYNFTNNQKIIYQNYKVYQAQGDTKTKLYGMVPDAFIYNDPRKFEFTVGVTF